MPGGEEVFSGDAEGFEEGDLVTALAAFFCSDQDFSYFSFYMTIGDGAFFAGDEEVACLVEKRFAAVGE